MKQTIIYLNGQQSKNFKTINKHSNENKNLKHTYDLLRKQSHINEHLALLKLLNI